MNGLTIVVSGPKATVSQAKTALAGSGFDVQATPHDHGLPATVTGEEIPEAQGFIAILGSDIDAAHEAVRPLGWALRAHWETPEPKADPGADLARTLAAMQAQIDALKAVS
jgi:hypothetical protein